MDVKKGDRVTLTCAGNTCTGEIVLCAPNQASLAIEIDEPLHTPTGMFARYVPLLMRDDGHYHELVDNHVVEIAVTQ
jgi:hypothetical protein